MGRHKTDSDKIEETAVTVAAAGVATLLAGPLAGKVTAVVFKSAFDTL